MPHPADLGPMAGRESVYRSLWTWFQKFRVLENLSFRDYGTHNRRRFDGIVQKVGGGFSLTPFPVPDTLPTTSQNSKHGVKMQATEAVPSSNSDFKSIASAM